MDKLLLKKKIKTYIKIRANIISSFVLPSFWTMFCKLIGERRCGCYCAHAQIPRKKKKWPNVSMPTVLLGWASIARKRKKKETVDRLSREREKEKKTGIEPTLNSLVTLKTSLYHTPPLCRLASHDVISSHVTTAFALLGHSIQICACSSTLMFSFINVVYFFINKEK